MSTRLRSCRQTVSIRTFRDTTGRPWTTGPTDEGAAAGRRRLALILDAQLGEFEGTSPAGGGR